MTLSGPQFLALVNEIEGVAGQKRQGRSAVAGVAQRSGDARIGRVGVAFVKI
jgi:hypothetical protein